jgi:hypothetical protein
VRGRQCKIKKGKGANETGVANDKAESTYHANNFPKDLSMDNILHHLLALQVKDAGAELRTVLGPLARKEILLYLHPVCGQCVCVYVCVCVCVCVSQYIGVCACDLQRLSG